MGFMGIVPMSHGPYSLSFWGLMMRPITPNPFYVLGLRFQGLIGSAPPNPLRV